MSRLLINIKGIAFPVLIVIVFLLIPSSAWSTTYVVFRYDDFTGDRAVVRSNYKERKQLWEVEQSVDKLLEKYEVTYVISIIANLESRLGFLVGPLGEKVSFEEDLDKVEFIKRAVQAGKVEVAQHGPSHTNNVKRNQRHGEFRECAFDIQLREIVEGKRMLLESCGLSDISTFVPPWNGWDRHTARALKKAGDGEPSNTAMVVL